MSSTIGRLHLELLSGVAIAHGMTSNRVLFETEESVRTIPQHLLIGSGGRTWYRYVGYLETEQMQQLLDDRASGRRVPRARDTPVR